MNFKRLDPPREFRVGRGGGIVLKDCGRVQLDPDEQVTFETESGGEYDVVRKSWGFYGTPSRNARLRKFGLRAVLTRGAGGKRIFVLLIERGREEEFHGYLGQTGMTILCWLDSDEAVRDLEAKLGGD